MQKKGIIIVGNPRSLTTVLERYFIARKDFKIYHEPIVRREFSKALPFAESPYQQDLSKNEIL